MKLDIDKSQLGLAGEFRVASELIKRGFNASITFGNAKATDIVVLTDNGRFLRIEVKTSKNGRNFVTGYYPKYTDPARTAPNIWVLYIPSLDASKERFFVLTHSEAGEVQLVVNKGNKTERGQGVDNIPIRLLDESYPHFESRWELFQDVLSGQR